LEPKDFQAVEAVFRKMVNEKVQPRALDLFVSMLRCSYPNERELALIRKLLTRLRQPDVPLSFEMDISENDRPFAESIVVLTERGIFSTTDGVRPDWPIRDVGQELDFLAHVCFLPDLSLIQLVNLLLLRRIRPFKSVAAVVSMRDEGLYLLEWIAFYRAIGLTDIFVYTNDNADGSDELLCVLANLGIIRLVRNHIRRGTNFQRKVIQHAFHLVQELRLYRWLLFIDADEFLVLNQRYDYNINNFIGHVEATFSNNLPGAVVFPWDWRLSDRGFKKTDGLLLERYPHSIRHRGVKSLTRLGTALGMCEVHIPTLEEGAIPVDSGLLPIETKAVWGEGPKSDRGGVIAHFWGKSFQEFAIKKRRGDLLLLEEKQFYREFSEYFEWTAHLSAENFHPLPPALIERTRLAIEVLKALPDVTNGVEQIGAGFAEFSKKIEKEMNLRTIYEEMYTKIQPVLIPF
jgi:hypothetical protein